MFVSGNGRTHVIVDVVGYFTPDAGTGGYLVTLTPKRVLGAALQRNVGSSVGASSVDVDLSSSLPAGATAAILNVTVASPSHAGYVVVYPAGTAQPGTSNVNFREGVNQANEVVVGIGAGRKVLLAVGGGTGSPASHLIADVVGYLR